MRFVKGSAGHLLAQAFMLPEFYSGIRGYIPTKKRTGRSLTKRVDKPARENLLTLLSHTKMRWHRRGDDPKTPGERKGMRLVLRQERNKRKAARRAAVSS